jgi:3-hydroxyisobutyrate dehydrogenase
MNKVLFIGLGTMGYPMAGHLSQNPKVNLSVFNRTLSKAIKWQEKFDATMMLGLDENISQFDVIILCSGQDEDIDEIFFGKSGIINSIQKNALVIDHTTISYQMTIKLNSALKDRGISFIDAPVSGGEIGAKNGTLAVMAGGKKDSIDNAKHIIDSYAQTITHMGEVGSGQLAKMANQICIMGILQGLSEAILFAEKNNLDIDKLINAISAGAAGSWQMDNRALTMHKREFDFGFALDWMIKDLTYTVNQAQKSNLELDLTTTVLHKYQKLSKDGYGKCDTSALIKALEND